MGVRKNLSGGAQLQIPKKYMIENLDYKGIRYDQFSRPFKHPSKDLLPNKFKEYLTKVNEKYQDNLHQPDPSLDRRATRIKRMLTENSTRSKFASTSSKTRDGFFGFSQHRFKTLQNQ